MSVVNSYCYFVLLVNIFLIHDVIVVRSSTSSPPSSSSTSTTKAPKLPDIPNAIHYPIYIPATSADSSSFLSPTFDLMGLSSNPWSSALSPLTALSSSSSSPSSSSSSYLPLSYDWIGQPFGIEVYDEQTLLRNREKLRRRQMEALRSREKMRQQGSSVHRRHAHGVPVINSYHTSFERSDNSNPNSSGNNHGSYNSYVNSDKKNNYAKPSGGGGGGSSSNNEAGVARKEYTSVRNSWQSEQGNSNIDPIWN